MDYKQYTDANREAWNEVTPKHQTARKENLMEKFKEKDYNALDPVETAKLLDLGVKGKRIAQLCCNNGKDLLSLLNLGAKSGVGFDISDEAIKEANRLQAISGRDCKFVRTDVYEIDKKYYESFDLVYITVGSLIWLPDLDRFFKTASNLLKPDGALFLYEIHPFTNMVETDKEWEVTRKQSLNDLDSIRISYFKSDPWIDETSIDYIGGTDYNAKIHYNFPQKFSDILNAIIQAKIMIQELTEYAYDISNEFKYLEKAGKVPRSYILIGKKVVVLA